VKSSGTQLHPASRTQPDWTATLYGALRNAERARVQRHQP